MPTLMFVGEGAGADEDLQGIPFVGRAGQLLTQIIKAMGFERDEVYIANVVKCRPPNNRNPEPDEIEQCEPFLMRQIDVIGPRSSSHSASSPRRPCSGPRSPSRACADAFIHSVART